MMPKFTIEEHEKRMLELLKPKPLEGLEGERPNVLQSLLDKAKKIKKPIEGEQKV